MRPGLNIIHHGIAYELISLLWENSSTEYWRVTTIFVDNPRLTIIEIGKHEHPRELHSRFRAA